MTSKEGIAPVCAQDDGYNIWRKLFFTLGFSRRTKLLNKCLLVFHVGILLLQFYYIFMEFSIELIARYGTSIWMLLYILFSMIFPNIVEKPISEILETYDVIAWSIHSVGDEAAHAIIDQAKKVNALLYFALVYFGFACLINLPILSDQRELYMCVYVFEKLFGSWSHIPTTLYFSTLPFLFYAAMRLPFMMLYGILLTQMQVVLVDAYICNFCTPVEDSELFAVVRENVYQRELYARLSLCARHHAGFKRNVVRLMKIVESAAPFVIVLGVLISLNLMTLVLYYFSTMSIICLVRLCTLSFGVAALMVMFCQGGQGLINQTGTFFDTLKVCPWYAWNRKNRMNLLIFMSHCLEPLSFRFVGFTVDYPLLLAVLRTAFSYAFVFYNFRK